MTPTGKTTSGHFHAVRFYQDTTSLSQIVCEFVTEGFKNSEPAVVFATADHAGAFRGCLASKDVDVDEALGDGRLTMLDADTTLAQFMRNGMPVAQAFNAAMVPVLDAVNARYPGATIRAYGEMVDVLWKQGQTAAAIRLEMLWNDLARIRRFGLLCGYAMGNFYKEASTDEICGQHSHVVTDTGDRIPLI
jgi:hypothetical protein